MSTKTAFKRVALVAAAALAIGGVSAVSAYAVTNTTTSAVATAATNPVSGVVGTATTADAITLTTTTTPTVGEVITLTPTIISKPVGSLVTVGTIGTGTVGLSSATISTNWTAAVAAGVVTQTSAGTPTAAAAIAARLQLTADVPGTYVVAVTPSGALTTNTAVSVTFTITNAGAAQFIVPATSTPVVGAYDSITLSAGTADKRYTITSTGVGTIAVPSVAAGTANNTPGTSGITSTGATYFNSSTANDVPGSANNLIFVAGAVLNLSAYSATAGTQTITVTGDVSAAVTTTITWGAAPTVQVQYSTAYIGAGSTPVSVDATVSAGDTASNTTVAANIAVTLNSAASTPITNQGLSVSISGPGTLGLNPSTAVPTAPTGRSLSIATTSNTASYSVAVFPDGTAGVSTITIVSGTTTIATKTVTFVGSAAKATATQGLFVLKAGSTTAGTGAGQSTAMNVAATDANVANTVALTGNLVDSNGNPASGTVQIVSSNTAVITAGACTAVTLTVGEYQCVVTGAPGALSGQTATVTFEAEDSNSNYTILATPLKFTIGGAITAEAFSTDATSYNALAPVSLTLTATDASKNLAYDQDITAGFVSSAVSSTQLGGTDLGTLLSKSNTPYSLINGVATYTGIYAPAVAGNFTITATDAASGNSEAVTSVTATSLGGSADASANAATDAANEATDAANAATDAANAAADSADAATQAAQDAGDKADAALAAVTALSQQVTTLLAKVAALATTIAKIAKKVKA